MHLIDIVYIICAIIYVNLSKVVPISYVTSINVSKHTNVMYIIFISVYQYPSIIIALLVHTIVTMLHFYNNNNMGSLCYQISSIILLIHHLMRLSTHFDICVTDLLCLHVTMFYAPVRCVLLSCMHHPYHFNIFYTYNISTDNG